MSTAENIAAERRVAVLERVISGRSLLLIRTTLVVCERGPEPDYVDVGAVLAAAAREPEVRELRRIPDLELLIDPVTRTRKLRHTLSPEGQARFDALKQNERVKVVDIEIRCHPGQLKAILSTAPTVAVIGGNRAGKTRFLAAWFLRRWILRGGDGKVFWWVAPTIGRSIDQGLWMLAGSQGLGGGVWPDAIFRELRSTPLTAKNPELTLIDGSKIIFKHAQNDNTLKSANVADAVIDELGAIRSSAVWFQLRARVSQSGGHVATATTLVVGHWLHDAITSRAEEVGADVIDIHRMTIFANPWFSWARLWQLFLSDRTLSRHQLESIVLPAEDKVAAALSCITDPVSLREHLGVETHVSRKLWPEWRDDFIYTGAARRHPTIDVYRDGRPAKLINITREVMARHWPRATQGRRSFDVFAGVDFNVRGHAVLLELFGEGRTANEAVANPASWTVLVAEEVQVDGTTLALGQQLKHQAGGPCAVWFDPHTGAGHAARGSAGTTDAEILRREGFDAAPSNGTNRDGKPRPLAQIDSRNVMHGLMRAGRFYVHERCTGLIDAMHKEVARPDGRVDKRSAPNSPSDFLSGFSDSTRYALWPVFRSMFVPQEQGKKSDD